MFSRFSRQNALLRAAWMLGIFHLSRACIATFFEISCTAGFQTELFNYINYHSLIESRVQRAVLSAHFSLHISIRSFHTGLPIITKKKNRDKFRSNHKRLHFCRRVKSPQHRKDTVSGDPPRTGAKFKKRRGGRITHYICIGTGTHDSRCAQGRHLSPLYHR